jgi:hypothetical protein
VSEPLSAAPLGILAGSGALPVAVAADVVRQGRTVHVVGLEGDAEPGIAAYPHTVVAWGAVGALLDAFRTAGCRELVIIGGVSRPDFAKLKFDFGALTNMPRILSLLVGGDDSVLSGVVRFFEAKGFIVRGAHEVAPGLLVPKGAITRAKPTAEHWKDIRAGMAVVEALGALDVGQAAVVTRGHVIAVEAVEGTDAMLRRAAELRQWGLKGSSRRLGVLVKCPKPRQELRVDMPAIGPRTVELAAAAGLAGIAVAAGGTLIAERTEVMRVADAEGLFVVGVTAPSPTAGD